MSLSTSVRRGTQTLTEFLWPARAEDRSIPVLDGGLSPNDALDAFEEVWRCDDGADDVAVLGDRLVVSHGSTVTLLDPGAGRAVMTLDLQHRVGALAADGDRRLYAVTVGGPVHEVVLDGDELRSARELPGGLGCPTAAAVGVGVLYVTEGSTAVAPDDWPRDLMTKGRTGRVLEVSLASGEQRVICQGLAWAGGVALAADGDLVVSEVWRHRLVRVDRASGAVSGLTRPLAGYPTRLCQGLDGSIVVAFLSLRTHLVEFVLREDEFRAEMLRTIDPQFWIRPAHLITDERWEPLQIGSIKHLNVTKPWAPPRAYGLLAVMDGQGDFVRSWHARVGSSRSGITAVALLDGRAVAVSRGSGCVLIETNQETR